MHVVLSLRNMQHRRADPPPAGKRILALVVQVDFPDGAMQVTEVAEAAVDEHSDRMALRPLLERERAVCG
ncbi:MAG TPA: hypothetical protein GXX50_06425 [Firmicutes bacterium]|nr:hypothetical protein [Bacillota bacterium]